jgi:hypothetical protein
MANAAAAATVWNDTNFLGELYVVGANQTPFLNDIGGLNGGKVANSWSFPLNQHQSLESAAQPAITETASLTAPAPVTYTSEQDFNVCQIFQEGVSVSYAKQSDSGTLAGLPIAGQPQPITNAFDHQKMMALRQIAIDAEYTFLNGAYQIATDAGVANKTRGMFAACTTNAVAAASAYLSKDLINTLLRSMADAGADFANMVMYANSFNRGLISDIYGYAPTSTSQGGVSIQTILTDFGPVRVQFAPKVPAASVGIFDIKYISPVFLPVPASSTTPGGILFYDPLAKVGASESGQIYGQMGLDYGIERYHGKITGLATS